MFNDIEILFTECKVDTNASFCPTLFFSCAKNLSKHCFKFSKNLALTLSTPTPTAAPSAQDFSNFRKLPAFLPSPVFFFFVLPSVIIRPPDFSNTWRSSWNVSILSSSLSIKIIQLSQLPAPSQESKFCLNNQQNKRISLQFWRGFGGFAFYFVFVFNISLTFYSLP